MDGDDATLAASNQPCVDGRGVDAVYGISVPACDRITAQFRRRRNDVTGLGGPADDIYVFLVHSLWNGLLPLQSCDDHIATVLEKQCSGRSRVRLYNDSHRGRLRRRTVGVLV